MSIEFKQRAGMLLVAGVALLIAALAILPAVAEAQDMGTVPTTAVESADVTTSTLLLPGGDTTAGDERSTTDVSGVVVSQGVNPPPSVGEAAIRMPDPGPEAQAGLIPEPSQPEPATRLVVNPGDSLWSISQGRLDPNASPRQVLSEVERIFEFNRDRIGGVPDLILPGQELLLPPPVTEEPAAAAPTAAPAAAPTAAPAAAVPERAPVPLSEPLSEPVALPDLPTVETVPIARVSVEPSPEPPYAFPRRALGFGVMVLSLAVAILMVWKLPTKRSTSWAPVAQRTLAELPRPSPGHQRRRSTGVLSSEPPKAKTQRPRAGDGNLDPTTRLESSPNDSRKEVNSDAV